MTSYDEESERWFTEPTRQPRWILDEEVTHCNKCRTEFSYTVYKHHCRKCGKIFCYDCCRNKALIYQEQIVMRPKTELLSTLSTDEEIYSSPQRVCDDCFEELLPFQTDLRNQLSRGYQEDIQDGSLLSLPAINFTLEQEVERAMSLLTQMGNYPKEFSSTIAGAVFLTVVKVGALFSGVYGSGFVISKLDDGWSAPCAVTLSGLGVGLQLGAEVTNMLFMLPNQTSVDAFKSKGQLVLGGEASISLIMGFSVEVGAGAGNEGVSLGKGLGMSQGIFAGGSIEVKVIAARNDVNHRFYGQKVNPGQLLSGEFPRPRALDSLNFTLIRTLS